MPPKENPKETPSGHCPVLLTGDRPSGPLHLGHYVGSLSQRLDLQKNHQSFIMIADVQALTDNFLHPEKVRASVFEVLRDYLAVGLDFEKCALFLQSQVPALAELTVYFMNLVSVSRVERNPTVKAEIAQKGYGESVPLGFFCYPVSQAADIAGFLAEVVPVGEDQLPMIELTNEIVRRFNRVYQTDLLREASAYIGNTPRLVGIDGQNKASKSLGNAIFLKDDPEIIREKVFAMYTDPHHVKISDPGNVEGNVVFAYLDAFYGDKEALASLKSQYTKGGLGDTSLKNLLNDTLQTFLAPIREKRETFSEAFLNDVLYQGIEKARAKVSFTLENVREVMGLGYGKFR